MLRDNGMLHIAGKYQNNLYSGLQFGGPMLRNDGMLQPASKYQTDYIVVYISVDHCWSNTVRLMLNVLLTCAT